eukprot:4009777-Pleurochrysis_carterae.AAC.1
MDRVVYKFAHSTTTHTAYFDGSSVRAIDLKRIIANASAASSHGARTDPYELELSHAQTKEVRSA